MFIGKYKKDNMIFWKPVLFSINQTKIFIKCIADKSIRTVKTKAEKYMCNYCMHFSMQTISVKILQRSRMYIY